MTPTRGSHRGPGSVGRTGPPPTGPGGALRAATVLAASPLTHALRGATHADDLTSDASVTGLPSIVEMAAELDALDATVVP